MTHENEIKLLEALRTQGECLQRLQDTMMLMIKSIEILDLVVSKLKEKVETIEVVQQLLKPLDENDRRG